MPDKEKLLNLKCKATGIGSVPHTDINAICDFIIQKCPDIPYWPQAENIDPREGMMLQYSENLPCLRLDPDNNSVIYDKSLNREDELVKFYDSLINSNYDYFSISREFASGFYTLLEKLENRDITFIKGQVVGPVTFLNSVIGENEKPILFDDELSDAVISGLALKGVWQAKKIKAAGKLPIIFFDEPAMAGFGSAFMSLTREQAMNIFGKLVETVKEHEDVIVGMHCCGNSDWEMILQTKMDIINFDAYAFANNFVLYSGFIKEFLNNGGIIAWGTVPTLEYNDNVGLDNVTAKFNEAIDVLVSGGIDRQFLLGRSIFTPACGTGTLGIETAEKIIDLTFRFANSIKP